MKKQGFTLIELIVSVTIIAVITVLAVVNFGGTSKRARDSRRMADLEKIRVALEQVRQVGSSYPSVAGKVPTGLTPDYLQTWPTDPKDSTYGYCYLPANPRYTYRLYARVEDTSNANVGSTSCGGTAGYNYEVRSP